MWVSLRKEGTHDRRGSKKEHEEDGVQPLESQCSDSDCGRWGKNEESPKSIRLTQPLPPRRVSALSPRGLR